MVSKDCGENWAIRKQLNGTSLLTKSDSVIAPFVPTASEWKNSTVSNITASYWTDEFRIMFEFNSGGGNDFYLDNINLYDPNMAGVNLLEERDFRLFPNPTQDVLHLINLKQSSPTSYSIYNCLGELLQSGSFSKQTQINTSELPPGTYLIQFNTIDQSVTKKFNKI